MNKELNEWLAVNVMGFERGEHIGNCGVEVWRNETGSEWGMDFWQPATDLSQALMCAEKWAKGSTCNKMEITISLGNKYLFSVIADDSNVLLSMQYAETTDELPLAICEAIKEAKGDK